MSIQEEVDQYKVVPEIGVKVKLAALELDCLNQKRGNVKDNIWFHHCT